MPRGVDFEEKLARMYRHLGYRVERTQASNDHGADLLLSKHGKTIAVQAKSYAKPVGNKAVQEAFAAQAYYGTRAAWVVTDSTFTAGAIAQQGPAACASSTGRSCASSGERRVGAGGCRCSAPSRARRCSRFAC